MLNVLTLLVKGCFSQVGFLSLLFLLFPIGEEDDLSLLTALLEENESALDCNSEESQPLTQQDGEPDAFDELFDADGDGESYTEEADEGEVEKAEDQKENLDALFGDMDDLADEDEAPTSQSTNNRVLPVPAPSQGKTNQELQGALPLAFSNSFTVALMKTAHLTAFLKIAAESGVEINDFAKNIVRVSGASI